MPAVVAQAHLDGCGLCKWAAPIFSLHGRLTTLGNCLEDVWYLFFGTSTLSPARNAVLEETVGDPVSGHCH